MAGHSEDLLSQMLQKMLTNLDEKGEDSDDSYHEDDKDGRMLVFKDQTG